MQKRESFDGMDEVKEIRQVHKCKKD